MKMLTRLMALMVALMMCFTMAIAESNADDVLLTVNGTPMTRAEFDEYLASVQSFYSSYGYDVTDESIASVLEQIALESGIQMIAERLMVVENGLSLTEDEKVAAETEAKESWEAVIADGMTYYGITDESTEVERAETLLTILSELEAAGYTEESYISDSLEYAEYNKLYELLTADVTVTEQDVLDYYNTLVEADKVTYADVATYEQTQYYNDMYLAYGMTDYYTEIYYMPEGFRAVTHILLEVDETLLTSYSDLQALYEEQQNTLEEGGEVTDTLVTADEVEAARLAVIASVQSTLDEINQKLADGASFNDLIPTYSADTGMVTADAIAEGYAVHMDSIMWDPVFTAAAFSVDTIGQVSEPVVGMYGVHLVHYDHDITGGGVELTEELKASFYESLLTSAQDEAYYNALDVYIGAAVIDYSDEAKTILGITDEAAE